VEHRRPRPPSYKEDSPQPAKKPRMGSSSRSRASVPSPSGPSPSPEATSEQSGSNNPTPGPSGDGSRGTITLSPVDDADNLSSDEDLDEGLEDIDTGISSVGDVDVDDDEPMLGAADLVDVPIPRNLMLTENPPVPGNFLPELDFPAKESFPCDKCDRSFKYAKSLKKHSKCLKCLETCIALSHKVCFDCKACVKNEDQFHVKCDKYKCDAPCFTSEEAYEEHTKTHGFEDF